MLWVCGRVSKNLTQFIGWVKENLMFAYKVGGWVKKGPKHAYVIYEWYLEVVTLYPLPDVRNGLLKSN